MLSCFALLRLHFVPIGKRTELKLEMFLKKGTGVDAENLVSQE